MELSTSEDLSGATCPFSTTIQSSLGLVCEYCNRYGCVNVNGGRKGERDKRGGGREDHSPPLSSHPQDWCGNTAGMEIDMSV